jgi:LAS superfamily LD-carboxypeptidase LdcB
MSPRELTGRDITHVVLHPTLKRVLHPEAAEAWLALAQAAQEAGHQLHPVSAFRSFDRQLLIWNEKWHGQRPLLDASEQPLNAATLSPEDKLQAILTWSALPGTSRHHWGTEIDALDLASWPKDRPFDLLQKDFVTGGSQHGFHRWLETHAVHYGFIRPYQGSASLQAEPWHLSFASIATHASQQLSADVVAEALHDSDLAGKELILPQLESLLYSGRTR